MSKYTRFVTKYQKSVITAFLVLAVLCVFLMPQVSVNYDMVDYLPEDAQSTKALSVMEDAFGAALPNARVMVSDVTVQKALQEKERIAAIDGVTAVTWLDDAVGLDTLTTTPVEYIDEAVVENFYKDARAVFTVTIESGIEKDTVAAIRGLIGEDNAVSGNAVNTATAQEMSTSEVLKAILILLPVILAILIIYTTSWLEPLLFLAAVGIAVLINMGTNVFFGEVSFITQTVGPILQLAVSLDYAIFLLHSFNEFRRDYKPVEAMRHAMKKALSSIAASAATTVVGFLALLFMRFGIGSDLGINLVKGVLLSFLSVMVFLPALTLICHKLIDRTKHRPIIPHLKGAGKRLTKLSVPFLILAVLIAVPCFLAQSNTEFMYGMGRLAETTRAGRDEAAIEEQFGKENTLVLLVEKGDAGREAELCDALAQIPHVTDVVSYVTEVGPEIPPEYVDEEAAEQFYAADYARIILYTDLKEEGAETFSAVQSILDTASQQYDAYNLAGQGATLYDMKNIVSTDTRTVTLAAVIGIFIVLLLTFRSLTIPVFLLFAIETAIWINLSFAYFSGQSFNFIGYLVVSTVQLGSTVDYAILMTDRYLRNRKQLSKKEAIKKTIDDNLIAVLVSAVILATAGFTMAFTSSNSIIYELGTLLGRGTLFSLLMVVCVLPALLIIFDKVIRKTTLGNGFHRKSDE